MLPTANAARKGLNLCPLILGCARSALMLGQVPPEAEGVPVRLTRIQEEKVPGRWLTNCPVDLGELSLRTNWDFLSLRAVHSSDQGVLIMITENIG